MVERLSGFFGSAGLTALELRDGNLWAAFEWTDPAAVEMVRAKQYL